MRRRWMVVLSLVALAACAEPEPPARCECKPPDPAAAGWPLYNQGVRWHTSLQEARALARKERKLVLYFVLVGALDKTAC